ncbi:MAG: RNA 2',3'-cyclic phosphodiesterase [Actinomycetota bacterium]|nr:RNA 2',3'-cyclic phosphodiesterase [Actinomycetota bacterium]
MFVAVDMPPAIKDAAASVIEAWGVSAPAGVRWVPRENLHLTMKFLGWVADERLSDIAGAVADAVDQMVDFSVRLGEAGAFPSARRARVLWLGLLDPAGGLVALARSLEDAFVLLGFAAEVRTFVPHLTIARLKPPSPVSVEVAVPPTDPFVVDRVTLFESKLGRPAPTYIPLSTFPFRRGSR